MGDITMGNYYLRQFCVWFILPLQIEQVSILIRWARTPIQRFLYPIRHVIPLASCICMYPAYHSHLHLPYFSPIQNWTIVTKHRVKSILLISPCHDHNWVVNTAHIEYSMLRARRPPTMVRHPFILTIMSWPVNVASAHGVSSYRSTASSQLSMRSQRSRYIATFPLVRVNKRMNEVLASGAAPISHLQIAHIQVHLSNHSMTASKFACSWPPSGMPNLLNDSQ